MNDSKAPYNEGPESFEDFKELTPIQRRYHVCCECDSHFSPGNTKTPAGWRDTQIVGMCERCYDKLFEEPDNGT